MSKCGGDQLGDKICILASFSQRSDIEEVVKHYKTPDNIIDYPKEQSHKTLFEIDYDFICKIASADRIIAISKDDGTFGESVTYELAIATYFGKPIETIVPVKKKADGNSDGNGNDRSRQTKPRNKQ